MGNNASLEAEGGPTLTTITGVAAPGDGTTRLDEAEATPAQEALNQAAVRQLDPGQHDAVVSGADDDASRRAARDGRAQYERYERNERNEAHAPPSAEIRQAVRRAEAASSPGRRVTSFDRSEGPAPAPAPAPADEAPAEYLCPITLSMMADPVVANDGHSYERAAIAHWLGTHNTSPQTREPMVSSELVPNHALRARIAAWRTQRGLDPLPARWIPPRAPAPAPQQQQRQQRPTALHLTNERMAVVCQAIHGVLDRAPELRRTLGLSAAPRGAVPRLVLSRPRAVEALAQYARDVPDLQHFAAVLTRIHSQQQRALDQANSGLLPPPPNATQSVPPPAPNAVGSRAAARLAAASSALRSDDASALVTALTGISPAHLQEAQFREDCANMAVRLGAAAPPELLRAAQYCATGDSILHAACAQGAERCATALIDRFGFDPAARALSDGATPLHLASFAGRKRLVEALLRRGADANARSLGADPNAVRLRDGPRPPIPADATPLHYACLGARIGRSEAVEALLAGGASPYRRDEHGSTPLHVCCHRGVDSAALALLKAASETPLTDDDQGVSASDRETAYASRQDYVERFSPLHRLAQSGREDWAPSNLIRKLVEASADVHSLSRRGLTPLHIAAAGGRAAACGALVRAGANAGYAQRGAAHETPLHAAVRARKVGALRAMLDDLPEASRRATCDATSCDGSTALHLACALGSVDACEALLDAGASVDARTHDGDSPLHVAAWTNSLAVADALLARGAPVDAAKLDGSTALHLCAARGLVAMTRSLLDHGADPTLRSVSGSTALDRARLFRDDRLARVLELAAATPPNSPTTTSC